MNAGEFEIYKAVRDLKRGPTLIRYLCLVCEGYLSQFDVSVHKGVCWQCRQIYFPEPKIEPRNPEPKKATLFQLKDGRYAILLG